MTYSVTLNSIAFADSDMAGNGYLDLIQVDGATYQRWQAFMVCGLKDLARQLTASSASSHALTTGAKTFVLAADVPYAVGGFVLVARTSDPQNSYLYGRVTAKSGTSLTVNVTSVGGSGGPFTDWTIQACGPAGQGGTVTSVAATPPAAGLAIAGSPITGAGTFSFSLANDLAALEGLAGTGIAVRSAADAWVQRSLAPPAAGLAIADADGVAGNPTFALANDLAAVEGLSGTGGVERTGADAWATYPLTAFAKTLLDDGNAAAARLTLDLCQLLPAYAAGRAYTMLSTGEVANCVVAASHLYTHPFIVHQAHSFASIGLNVQSGAGNCRLGIYQDDGGVPGALLRDCGTVSTATGGLKSIAIDQALAPGVYWLAVVFDAAPTVDGFPNYSMLSVAGCMLGPTSPVYANQLFRTFTYGALPDPFGTPAANIAIRPTIYLFA